MLVGPQYIPTDLQFDLILNLWADAECDGIHGFWWNEKLDALRFSAPRGVILPSKIAAWQAVPADFQALCDFQNETFSKPRR